jgi:anti-anti-sigma factor
VVTSAAGAELLRVTARGELDLVTVPVLDLAVREIYWLASGPRPGRFLLDLGGVTFLDVCGVRALGRIDRLVRDDGSRLDITGPTACGPRRLLALAVDFGWLPCEFATSKSTDPAA